MTNDRINKLKKEIKENDSMLRMDGEPDPNDDIIHEMQSICTHESVDVFDGMLCCLVCGKHLKRFLSEERI